MKKFNYTYTVKQVNIQDAHVLIEYMPEDKKLTAYTLNVFAYGIDENNQPYTLDELISNAAPHHMWEAQETLLAAADLLNKSERVTV